MLKKLVTCDLPVNIFFVAHSLSCESRTSPHFITVLQRQYLCISYTCGFFYHLV